MEMERDKDGSQGFVSSLSFKMQIIEHIRGYIK